jgi:hypothetical protein
MLENEKQVIDKDCDNAACIIFSILVVTSIVITLFAALIALSICLFLVNF